MDKYQLASRRAKENRKRNKHPYHHVIYAALQRNNIRFRTEYPVHVPNSPFFYILDFYLFELDIAIELDGKQHEDPIQQYKDKCKDEFCKENGVRIIRISSELVKPYINRKFPILDYLSEGYA